MKDEFGGGIGASMQIIEKLQGEAAFQFAYDFKTPGTMANLHLGLRYAATGSFEIFAAGGPSFGELMATPDFRIFAGVSYTGIPGAGKITRGTGNKLIAASDTTTSTSTGTPTDTGNATKPAADKCAAGNGHKPEDCPAADDDNDGIANARDNCPLEAEDKDGFADQDGCVDPDNDGDAVADKDDKCPNEAGLSRLNGCPIPDQDKDGIADADDKCPSEYGLVAQGGCPIKDEDGDGLVDSHDQCPKQAGLIELRGCPSKDSDADGIADHLDNCPKEKGLANNGGCKKTNKQLVVITREQLKIKDKIFFGNTNAKLLPRSFKLLKQVAAVIKSHEYIEKVVIEGHTDDKGDATKNRTLSLARADAVKSYLIKQGVDPTRLETKGLGPDQPIDTNKTAAGRANNRRVEFKVVMPTEEQPASM